MAIELVRALVMILGFTVTFLILHKLLMNWHNFAVEQRVLLLGNLLWGYALTHSAVLRLINHTPFTAQGFIAYVGTGMVVWALAQKIDIRLTQPSWQEQLKEEDIKTYNEIMETLEASAKLRESL